MLSLQYFLCLCLVSTCLARISQRPLLPPELEGFLDPEALTFGALQPLSASFFEGDILGVPVRGFNGSGVPPNITSTGSTSRNAMRDRNRRWPNGVVTYTIDDVFQGTQRSNILEAMRQIEAATDRCITFVPRTDPSVVAYIRIISAVGCASSIGRTGERQDLSLSINDRCPNFVGVIIHEFLHALGFWHEQSRSDRDNFVRIVRENIEPGQEHNFDRIDDSDNQNFAYDYESLMHYALDLFSRNGQPTIIPLVPGQNRIGQRGTMSQTDINELRAFYECGDGGTGPLEPVVIPEIARPPFPGCISWDTTEAGSTCATVAGRCQITVRELIRTNPSLQDENSCTGLAVATKLCCVSTAGIPEGPEIVRPVTGLTTCAFIRVIRAGDTCDTIATFCGIPRAQLLAQNSDLQNGALCNTLVPGRKLCC